MFRQTGGRRLSFYRSMCLMAFTGAKCALSRTMGCRQDDSFPFSMERSDPRKVLFLSRAGRKRGAFYYRTALEAASGHRADRARLRR